MPEAQKLPVKNETNIPASSALPGRWPSFENLRREIDRVFEGFHLGSLQFPFDRPAFEFELPWSREGRWGATPAVDVLETEKEYNITAELPGMDEKDIDIKLANGMLTIKGEKKEEKEKHEKDYYLSERRYGSFMRSFSVPEGVDTAKIEAVFAKGVLTVTLPKSAEAQKNEKKITIKSA